MFQQDQNVWAFGQAGLNQPPHQLQGGWVVQMIQIDQAAGFHGLQP
jgi:hypothetical protein